MSRYTEPKDPASIEPYFVVWCDETGTNVSGDRGDLQGATIATVTWTVPTGITSASTNQNAVTIDGTSYAASTVATIWLSGGTIETDYTLVCKITTSDTRTLSYTFIIPVRVVPA